MIYQNEYWFDILPRAGTGPKIDGKWLFFGPTGQLHAWLEPLDALVESGRLQAVKIARKLPGIDPFPDKPCVLCVFTSASSKDKNAARAVLKESLGIDVEIWKSELETERDWKPGGWLQVEAELNKLKRTFAGTRQLDTQARARLAGLSATLEGALSEVQSSGRGRELELSQAAALALDLRRDLDNVDTPLSAILSRLDQLQAQMDRWGSSGSTPPGQAALADQPKSKSLFVIMPFADEYVDTYDAIKRAAAGADPEIRVERVDEVPGSIPITDTIRKSIRSATLIVCDLSAERPNVYYELGFAHGLAKDVICVAKKGTVIHFDVYGFKIVFFERLRELESLLAKEIRALLSLA